MDNRFFITEVYVPSGTRTLEHNLAAVVEPYVDCILSENAMIRLQEKVVAEHNRLFAAQKRLRPVPIVMDLDGTEDFGYRYFHIGQVSVRFRLVKGEII